jgi:UDP-glucuronate 4-epimerase
VYGPWGRPDMAPFLFTKAAFEGTPIKVFNHGDQQRDFTYIDDIVNGIVEVLIQKEKIQGADICNIGQGKPVNIGQFLEVIEEKSYRKLKKEYVEAQPGDVSVTYADTSLLKERFSYVSQIPLETGIEKFINWFTHFYSWSN